MMVYKVVKDDRSEAEESSQEGMEEKNAETVSLMKGRSELVMTGNGTFNDSVDGTAIVSGNGITILTMRRKA